MPFLYYKVLVNVTVKITTFRLDSPQQLLVFSNMHIAYVAVNVTEH